jgi:hypothetical protein
LPQILFKKPFKAAILAGRKTTTLRRWRVCRLKAGDRVRVPGVGELILQAVEPVEWESLTDADAQADGFESMSELSRVIRRIYPNLHGDGKSWFRIKFRAAAASRKRQLAAAVRAELDKAVRGNGSLAVR